MKKSRVKRRNKKKRQAESEENVCTDHTLLVEYLKKWKTARDQWKFEKVKQIRLVSGMLDPNKVPEDVFPIFVEYMESSKGKIKTIVMNKANEIIEEMEKWSSLSEEEKENATKPDDVKYSRARLIIQMLN